MMSVTMQSTMNVPVIHGNKSWPIAMRLAMDLSSEGFVASPVALDGLTSDVRAQLFAEIEALVVVYDGQTWITPEMYAALDELRLRNVLVVFARTRTSKYPDYFPFQVVVLFDMPTFSNYQPNKQGTSGFALVAGLLRMRIKTTRPRDRRRRGFAFISYASEDLSFVNGSITNPCDLTFAAANAPVASRFQSEAIGGASLSAFVRLHDASSANLDMGARRRPVAGSSPPGDLGKL